MQMFWIPGVQETLVEIIQLNEWLFYFIKKIIFMQKMHHDFFIDSI